MSEIRYALYDDIKEIRNLWEYSFSEEESFLDYYFDKRYNPGCNLIAKETALLASLQRNPYKINISKDSQNTAYVVGISVYPEHRGKKLTTKLLNKALEEAYNLGEKISLLMPIDTAIYRRYGYENCFSLYSFEVNLSDIEYKNNKSVNLERITKMTDELADLLIEIYLEKAKNWDIYLERDRNHYYTYFEEIKVEAGEIFLAKNNANEPIGYMVFYPKMEASKGYVRELFYLDSSALDSFMTLVASHKTQLDSVTIQQPIDSQLMYYFGFNNKISVSLKPFMMARIVDVKYVLEKLAKDMILDLSIKINDGILSQNNQVFHIKNGSVAISDNKADAEMDIGTLTQLYMGTVSVSSAYDLGKIEAENINMAQLNRLFSYKISYVNEYI